MFIFAVNTNLTFLAWSRLFLNKNLDTVLLLYSFDLRPLRAHNKTHEALINEYLFGNRLTIFGSLTTGTPLLHLDKLSLRIQEYFGLNVCTFEHFLGSEDHQAVIVSGRPSDWGYGIHLGRASQQIQLVKEGLSLMVISRGQDLCDRLD